MEDIDYELKDLIPASESLQHFPPVPGGGQRATSWLYHILNLSNDPTRKTLRSVLVGRYRYTTLQWIREFLNGKSPTVKPAKTPGQRERHQAKVKRQLQEAGL